MHGSLFRFTASLTCIGAAAAAACSSATGAVRGGEPAFDAAPPIVETPQLEAGASGHTWTDLYRDYFGPTGVASCAGNGNCHGDPAQPGAQASRFVCPRPETPDAGGPADASGDALGEAGPSPEAGASDALARARTACLDSLKGGSGLITPGTPPDQTGLYAILRKDSGGTMPQNPPYKFSAGDLKRITDWIAAGANND